MSSILQHHLRTIERTTDFFRNDPAVEALILGGSLAHGFATASSDVDVMMVVSDTDYQQRLRQGQTCFFSRELCVYPEGYVDGKYISAGLIDEVVKHGSDPSRFAFKDAQLLFSRNSAMPELLRKAAEYPRGDKAARLWRFQAQFEAWLWYCSEALRKQNLPLLRTAVAKLTLFGGRIVLTHNELLYPYHKWFLRVLADAPDKPPRLMELIQALAEAPDAAAIEQFGETIRKYKTWEISHATWPAQFMQDSELNWLRQDPPVDDL
jgi:hypothetical protein